MIKVYLIFGGQTRIIDNCKFPNFVLKQFRIPPMLQVRVCVEAACPAERTPSGRLSGETWLQLAGETAGKTNNYLLELKAAGLDTDRYNFPRNQWCMDAGVWPVIGFPDIYISKLYRISTPGKYLKSLNAWSCLKVVPHY